MQIKDEQKELLVEQVRSAQTKSNSLYPHIVICGPSGSGKTTIIRLGEQSILGLKSDIYDPSVSCATRDRRPNEIDGLDYRFMMSLADFGVTDFFETNEYTGNKKLYGTPVSEIERICLRLKKRMLLDIDPNGAMEFQKFFGGDVYSAFLDTSDSVLEKRLSLRGESAESIKGRLIAARKERNLVRDGLFKPNLVLPYDEIPAAQAVNLILLKVAEYMEDSLKQ